MWWFLCCLKHAGFSRFILGFPVLGIGGLGKGIPQGLKPLSSNAAERAKPEGLAYLEATATAALVFRGIPHVSDDEAVATWGTQQGNSRFLP